MLGRGPGRIVRRADRDAETGTVTRTTIAAILAACFGIGTFALGDEPRFKGKDKGTVDPAAGMAVEADLATIGPPPGAMAGVIERFGADRTSIARSTAPPELSPARDDLRRRFAESWLHAMESLDFEAMSVDERGRLSLALKSAQA